VRYVSNLYFLPSHYFAENVSAPITARPYSFRSARERGGKGRGKKTPSCRSNAEKRKKKKGETSFLSPVLSAGEESTLSSIAFASI